ncbi:MAG: transglutaminase domain-containing protein [bacterium]|nr:transglutaminase domain-containing protein [bacterium]MDT8366265.1 transglutaminase domain-containing protein [bacterium]
MTKSLLTVVGVTVIFGTGFILGEKMATRHLDFANMRVNHALEYKRLIEHYSPDIKSLAERLQTPEEAYKYVRDQIQFEPWRSVERPSTIIREGAASCLGKAVLLCSIYRAMGVEPESTFVVTGQVVSDEGTVEHAWVSLIHDGTHYQQDPSNLLGHFDFGDFPERKYSRSFISAEKYCFNDQGFAVVSQLNRMGDASAQ